VCSIIVPVPSGHASSFSMISHMRLLYLRSYQIGLSADPCAGLCPCCSDTESFHAPKSRHGEPIVGMVDPEVSAENARSKYVVPMRFESGSCT